LKRLIISIKTLVQESPQFSNRIGIYVKTALESHGFYTINPLAFRGKESSLFGQIRVFHRSLGKYSVKKISCSDPIKTVVF